MGLNVKRERIAQENTTNAKIYHGHKKVTLHHVKIGGWVGGRAGVQQIRSTSCGHNSLGRASFIEDSVEKVATTSIHTLFQTRFRPSADVESNWPAKLAAVVSKSKWHSVSHTSLFPSLALSNQSNSRLLHLCRSRGMIRSLARVIGYRARRSGGNKQNPWRHPLAQKMFPLPYPSIGMRWRRRTPKWMRCL